MELPARSSAAPITYLADGVQYIVIAVGGVAYLVTSGGQVPHYETFRGEPSDLRSIHGIVVDAAQLHARGVIQLGLLLLVATPIARVIGALGAFALRRDATYVVISSLVLAALLYSLLAS
ncbi:MAG: DUF1634 domain-containing protein [Chloroflexi bacterium]|nr:DUF1634 domain-containing protein [Chloroflexota bacterium]